MPSHRPERVAEAIREVVSTAILFDVADPRVKGITVLRAEVSGDLRNATVYVTAMGTPAEQRRALHGLDSARGFLQAKVAGRLQIKHAPTLIFRRDEGVKKSVEMSRLIDEALNRVPPDAPPEDDKLEADDIDPDEDEDELEDELEVEDEDEDEDEDDDDEDHDDETAPDR